MATQPEQFEGLEWIETIFTLVPRWTIDPDIERVKETIKTVLVLPSQQEITVTFLAKGSFNKLYNIRFGEKELVLRVSLPVDPRWKTLSEVATVEWVRRNTDLPVPKIFAHDATRDNPIRFEWILMSKVHGGPLADVWRSIDFEAKKRVTRQLAIFSSSLFKKQLRGIGNIFSVSKLEEVDDSNLPEVKRIVSMPFFLGDHISQPVPRGPFRSSKDWLAARLLFYEHDSHSTLARCNDKEDPDCDDSVEVKDARRLARLVNRLKLLLNDLFPSDEEGTEPEPSMLCHDDLSQQNILVDETGALTGVVDWECVSALPLWRACDYPTFLQGPSEVVEPVKAQYKDGDKWYWHELRMYEIAKLREFFLEEMRRLEPGWVKVFEASQRKREFDLAMENVATGHVIHEWIDHVTTRIDPVSLWDMLF